MANKKLARNKKVLKAISLGLAAMMAIMPATNVYADDSDADSAGGGEAVVEEPASASAEISQESQNSAESTYSEAANETPSSTSSDNGNTVTTETRDLNLDLNDDSHKYENSLEDNAVLDALRDGTYKDDEHEADIEIDEENSDEGVADVLAETDYKAGTKQGVTSVNQGEDENGGYVETTTKKVTVTPGEVTWEEPQTVENYDEDGRLVGWTTTTQGSCDVEITSNKTSEREYNTITTTKTTTTTAPETTALTADDLAKILSETYHVYKDENGVWQSSSSNISVEEKDGKLFIKEIANVEVPDDTEITSDGDKIVLETKKTVTSDVVIDGVTSNMAVVTTTTTTIQPKETTITISDDTEYNTEHKQEIKENNDNKQAGLLAEIEQLDNDDVKRYLTDEAKSLFAALDENQKVVSTQLNKTDSVESAHTSTGEVSNEGTVEKTEAVTKEYTKEEAQTEYEKALSYLTLYNAAEKDDADFATITDGNQTLKLKFTSTGDELSYVISLENPADTDPEKVEDKGSVVESDSVTTERVDGTLVVTKVTTCTQEGEAFSTTSFSNTEKTVTVKKEAGEIEYEAQDEEKIEWTSNNNIEVNKDNLPEKTETVELEQDEEGNYIAADGSEVPQEILDTINDIAAEKESFSVTLNKGTMDEEEEWEDAEVELTSTTTTDTVDQIKLFDDKTLTAGDYYAELQKYIALAETNEGMSVSEDGKYDIKTTIIENTDGSGYIIRQERTLKDEYRITADTEENTVTQDKLKNMLGNTVEGDTVITEQGNDANDETNYIVVTETTLTKEAASFTNNEIVNANYREVITIELIKSEKNVPEGVYPVNALDYTNCNLKVVTGSGVSKVVSNEIKNTTDENELSDASALNAVRNFLDALNIASDFVIYADSWTTACDHTEGNICANSADYLNGNSIGLQPANLPADTTLTEAEKNNIRKQYTENGFTYIGSTVGGDQIYITSVGSDGKKVLITSQGVPTGMDGASNGTIINNLDGISYDNNGNISDESLNALLGTYPVLWNYNEVTDINDNLDAIGFCGSEVSKKIGDTNISIKDQVASINNVVGLLEAGNYDGQDVITINLTQDFFTTYDNITVGSETLSFNEYVKRQKLIKKLYNLNTKGATILFNINFSENIPDELRVSVFSNNIDAHAANAGNIVWNFGNYSGKVDLGDNFGGVIVAPKASVTVGQLQSGRIIAKSATNYNEIHQDINTIKTATDKISEYVIKGSKETSSKIVTNTYKVTQTGKKTGITIYDAVYQFDVARNVYSYSGNESTVSDKVTRTYRNGETWTKTEQYSLVVNPEDNPDVRYILNASSSQTESTSVAKKATVSSSLRGRIRLSLEERGVTPYTPPTTPDTPTPPVTPPPVTPPVTPPTTPPTTPGVPTTPGTPTEGVLGVRAPRAGVLGERVPKSGVLGARVLGARTEDTANQGAAAGVILGSLTMCGAWMIMRRKKVQ